MRESSEKILWGRVEKIGKGTRASYDPDKKTITFCFTRNPQTSSDQLKKLRELLMIELNKLGHSSRMKYNGEVIVDNIQPEDVALETKNHQLTIHLKKKQTEDKEKDTSEQQPT
jgi:hypothetical protein